jgi:excisionase family DNA binding protein
MQKTVLQMEILNSNDFKNEIINGVITALKSSGEHPQDNNDEIILSREEAAKLLSISLVTLWDLTRKDKIQAFRIGNKVRYKKSDVLNALTQKNKFE